MCAQMSSEGESKLEHHTLYTGLSSVHSRDSLDEGFGILAIYQLHLTP